MQIINVFNGNIEKFILRVKISDIDKIGFILKEYIPIPLAKYILTTILIHQLEPRQTLKTVKILIEFTL